jgi:hypothetical protein
MTAKKIAFRTVLFGILLVGLSACSSSKDTISEENQTRDIEWLTRNLQDDGIFVSERGEARANIAANLTRRLLLNRNEYVDAYYFESAEKAEAQAHIYAGYNPNARVYRTDGLVVIRYREDLTEVAAFLNTLMGATI